MERPGTGRLLIVATISLIAAMGFARAEEPRSLTKLADAHLAYGGGDKAGVKLTGEVEQVILLQYSALDEIPAHAVVLRLKGADGEALAYMGPKLYLDEMGYRFAAGERLDLEGIQAEVNGQVMVVTSGFTDARGTWAIRNGQGSISLSKR